MPPAMLHTVPTSVQVMRVLGMCHAERKPKRRVEHVVLEYMTPDF